MYKHIYIYVLYHANFSMSDPPHLNSTERKAVCQAQGTIITTVITKRKFSKQVNDIKPEVPTAPDKVCPIH